MSRLRRLVLVRHGETVGNSSVRLHGSADLPLSDEGREQMRRAGRELRGEPFELVVASSMRRSWEGAAIVTAGAPIRLESDFREIDFGRWEGLTAEEVESADPLLYRDWVGGVAGFEYPDGEPRAAFRSRIERGLERLKQSDVHSALVVVHKGVIRTIFNLLLGEPIADTEAPPLGGRVTLSRGSDDRWREGLRSSDPPALVELAG